MNAHWREEVEVLKREQESAAQEIAARATDLMTSSPTLSSEPREADLLMAACDMCDNADAAADIVREMNLLQEVVAPTQDGNGEPVDLTWEAASDSEIQALEHLIP